MIIEKIKKAFSNTEYMDCVYQVGGSVRDEILGCPVLDIDLLVEGSVINAVDILEKSGICDSKSLVYQEFNTAMVFIDGQKIEIAGARCDEYKTDSRKPLTQTASLADDANRRDFTVNTLLKNIYTGEITDPTGRGLNDLKRKILRTPVDPIKTFYEDPLRILRAVRFSIRFDFLLGDDNPLDFQDIELAIKENAYRLDIVSRERIRDEFIKIISLENADQAIVLMDRLGVLDYVVPDLNKTKGVEQGPNHIYDVWEHSLCCLKYITRDRVDDEDNNFVNLRLAALLHDIAKPYLAVFDDSGILFPNHQMRGSQMAESILKNLRMPGRDIETICFIIENHSLLAKSVEKSDGDFRRAIRNLGKYFHLVLLHTYVDKYAANLDVSLPVLKKLEERLESLYSDYLLQENISPLNGNEIKAVLFEADGKSIGKAKQILEDAVLDGLLELGDKNGAADILKERFN